MTKARLFSFHQLYDFNNLFLNKSFLRKRVRSTEEDIWQLQNKVAALESWRPEHEQDMKDQFAQVAARFEDNDERHARFLQTYKEQQAEVGTRIGDCEALIKNIFATLGENKEERQDLRNQADFLDEKLDKQIAVVNKTMSANYTKLLDKQNYAEREANQSMNVLSKEIEKLKYELGDTMDGKFEAMTKTLDAESRRLKSTYEELSTDLTSKSRKLVADFKERMHSIKAMVATHFAKIDAKVSTNDAQVLKISNAFDDFSTKFINPSQELDGKVFAMNTRIEESDQAKG